MTYTLIVPNSYLRQAKKFIKAHPDLKDRVEEVLLALEEDPFHPQLRLHPLLGKLAGFHAVSITHSYRITLTLKISEQEIILIDIGSHDDVYR